MAPFGRDVDVDVEVVNVDFPSRNSTTWKVTTNLTCKTLLLSHKYCSVDMQ